MEGLKKLYEGDFNNMTVEVNPDGTQTITISSHGDAKAYRFRVVNLYQDNERLLEHEVIKIESPDYINKRIDDFRKVDK